MEETMRKTIAFMTATVLALPLGSALADQGMKNADAPRQVQGAPGAMPANLMSSDDIIGSEVRDTNGDELGNVDDLLVGKDGKIDAAIVSLGGVFGVGDRKVKVPWNALNVKREAGDRDDLFVTASRQTLQSAPQIEEEGLFGTDRTAAGDRDDDDPRSARTTGDAPLNPNR